MAGKAKNREEMMDKSAKVEVMLGYMSEFRTARVSNGPRSELAEFFPVLLELLEYCMYSI